MGSNRRMSIGRGRTSLTSAARRAATRVRMKWLVGISTLLAAHANQPAHAACWTLLASPLTYSSLQHRVETRQQGRRCTSKVAALLLGGQLVLEVHASGACLNHGLQIQGG
jgi:hypothetical protein